MNKKQFDKLILIIQFNFLYLICYLLIISLAFYMRIINIFNDLMTVLLLIIGLIANSILMNLITKYYKKKSNKEMKK